MTLSLQVAYPITDDTNFDMDYYLATHLPLVAEHMGEHISSTSASKGLAGGPDQPPGYYVIATMTFADQAALDSALGAAEPVLADIPKFTSAQPQMLIGEVIA
ncbi:MAG: EthD family reductase [Thalassovita sp.]